MKVRHSLNEGSVVYQTPGSIGSSSTEIARLAIEGDAVINELILRLQGKMIVYDKDGRPYEEAIDIPADQRYKQHTLLWFKSQMQTVLSKSLSLSDITDQEMYSIGLEMAFSFDTELWQSWKMYLSDDFEISINQYAELCGLHTNFLDLMLRHPREGGIRKFLNTVYQEQKLDQASRVTEMQEKKGGLFGTGLLR